MQLPNPIARRESVDEILLGRLSLAPTENISGVCLRGRPGNGKRILATKRLPELFPTAGLVSSGAVDHGVGGH